ncbi:MAG: hypothetical protein JNM99_08800 [Verrucomicrobiaceae bacterium]|nr:hypothetical protein [Verrucomicrobiaceae bacterium]
MFCFTRAICASALLSLTIALLAALPHLAPSAVSASALKSSGCEFEDLADQVPEVLSYSWAD